MKLKIKFKGMFKSGYEIVNDNGDSLYEMNDISGLCTIVEKRTNAEVIKINTAKEPYKVCIVGAEEFEIGIKAGVLNTTYVFEGKDLEIKMERQGFGVSLNIVKEGTVLASIKRGLDTILIVNEESEILSVIGVFVTLVIDEVNSTIVM